MRLSHQPRNKRIFLAGLGFKAILEENNSKVLKIQNITRLFDKINQYINFTIDEKNLEKTDEVYIETQYLRNMSMLPDGKPSINQAKKLFDFADYIFHQTVKMLE